MKAKFPKLTILPHLVSGKVEGGRVGGCRSPALLSATPPCRCYTRQSVHELVGSYSPDWRLTSLAGISARPTTAPRAALSTHDPRPPACPCPPPSMSQ